MKYVSLPDDSVHPLPFYLAMEEYLARKSREELFFMWQVTPTVIFGRNQLINNEVNIDYCRAHDISFYRRKSGGGCVYADMDNIMFSYIVTGDDVTDIFARYTGRVAAMLRDLGVNAQSTGRNDVTIDGLKVSGNAFYQTSGRSIVHGTMLFDTDVAHMSRAISPSRTKLDSKGVESVRSHITVLSRHLSMGIDEFKDEARRLLCDGELRLNAVDVEAIERLSLPYYDEKWIYGKNPRCTLRRHERIEGVGEFEVEIELSRNRIANLNIAGDYFPIGDIDAGLVKPLMGVGYNYADVARVVAELDLSRLIAHIDKEQLIKLIIPDDNGKCKENMPS